MRPSVVFLAVSLTAACSSGSAGRSGTTLESDAPNRSSTATTTAAAQPQACEGRLMWLTAGQEIGATGHGAVVVVVVNASQQPCVLDGHPDVALVGHDSTGNENTRFNAVPSEGGFMLSNAPGTAVTLSPGHAAFFGLEDAHICGPTASANVRTDQAEVTINGSRSAETDPIPLLMISCGAATVGAFRDNYNAVIG